MKYRSKHYPNVVVEAIPFYDDPDSLVDLVAFGIDPVHVSYENPERPYLKLDSFGSTFYVAETDYIVRTEHAALCSIPAEFFLQHFEEVPKNG